jgi:hypothetical protein
LKPTKEVFLSILFACIAMVFVSLMIVLVPSPTTASSLNDKIVVTGFFIASCFVGMSFALHPGWIRRSASKKIHTTAIIYEESKRSFSGHHPDCERFQSHRLTLGKTIWCAGCFGLLIGSLISIAFMVIYTISSTSLSRSTYGLLLLLGLLLVLVINLETIAKSKNAVTHLVLNGMLIPGFFFITMSVTELTGKALFGVFTIFLCALWLDTRVTLSRWRHRSICNHCEEPCKMYAQARSNVSK